MERTLNLYELSRKFHVERQNDDTKPLRRSGLPETGLNHAIANCETGQSGDPLCTALARPKGIRVLPKSR